MVAVCAVPVGCDPLVVEPVDPVGGSAEFPVTFVPVFNQMLDISWHM
jgi:hypothetical protein